MFCISTSFWVLRSARTQKLVETFLSLAMGAWGGDLKLYSNVLVWFCYGWYSNVSGSLNNFKRAHKIVVKELRIWKNLQKLKKIDQWLDNKNVNIDNCSDLLRKKCLAFQAAFLKSWWWKIQLFGCWDSFSFSIFSDANKTSKKGF